MNIRLTILCFALLVFDQPVWSARMPRGSFLEQPVASVWQLTRQVQSNSRVAARFERHFGTSAAQFIRYAQTNLTLSSLKSSGRYQVFHIKKDGSIGSSVRRLKKGTAVFVHRRTGTAVLLAECGNPMGTSLPGYTAPRTQNTPPRTNNPAPQQEPELPNPPPAFTQELLPMEDTAQELAQVADLPFWQAEVALSLPDLPVSDRGAVFHTASPFPTPLFAMGLGALVSPGGRSSGGHTTPPAVPEPASVVLWAVAGGGLILLRRVRQR